jgi:hypothetical protein
MTRYIIFALSLLIAFPAFAKTDVEQCVKTHDSCSQNCLELDTEGSKAACVAKCAGQEAKCAGEIGLGTTEPFMRKKAKELEDLLDKFLDDILPNTPPPPPADTPEHTKT